MTGEFGDFVRQTNAESNLTCQFHLASAVPILISSPSPSLARHVHVRSIQSACLLYPIPRHLEKVNSTLDLYSSRDLTDSENGHHLISAPVPRCIHDFRSLPSLSHIYLSTSARKDGLIHSHLHSHIHISFIFKIFNCSSTTIPTSRKMSQQGQNTNTSTGQGGGSQGSAVSPPLSRCASLNFYVLAPPSSPFSLPSFFPLSPLQCHIPLTTPSYPLN